MVILTSVSQRLQVVQRCFNKSVSNVQSSFQSSQMVNACHRNPSFVSFSIPSPCLPQVTRKLPQPVHNLKNTPQVSKSAEKPIPEGRKITPTQFGNISFNHTSNSHPELPRPPFNASIPLNFATDQLPTGQTQFVQPWDKSGGNQIIPNLPCDTTLDIVF